MHTSIKLLSLVIALNITHLHGMEVETPNKKRRHSTDELITSTDVTVMEVEAQKDHTYLWLMLPDDVIGTIVKQATADKLFYSVQLLIRLSWICKAFKYYSEPGKIKAVLNLSQETLNYKLRFHVHFDEQPTQYAHILFKMGAEPQHSLSHSLVFQKPDLAKLIIEYGGDINHQDDLQMTPLHHAIQANQIEIVQLLLSKGANMYLKDTWGHSAVHEAMHSHDLACLKLLIEHGLDTSIKYHYGKDFDLMTIAEWAEYFRHREIYELVTHEQWPKTIEEMSPSELLHATKDYMYNLITTPLHLSSFMG